MYTILNAGNGNEPIRGLSLADAAQELLLSDGHDYEIRAEPDGGFTLWLTQFSRNSTLGGKPMVRSRFFSTADTMADAEKELFGKVVRAEWRGYKAVADEDYIRQETEIAAAEDE